MRVRCEGCGAFIEPGDDIYHCYDDTMWHLCCFADADYPCHGDASVADESYGDGTP